MAPSRAEVLRWLETRTGRALAPADQADLLRATRLDGNEAETLMQDFAAAFGVDLAAYPAGLHHASNARRWQPGWPVAVRPPCGLFFPLSLDMLADAARAGRWTVIYPALPRVESWHGLNIPLLLIGIPALTAGLIALLF